MHIYNIHIYNSLESQEELKSENKFNLTLKVEIVTCSQKEVIFNSELN